MTSTIATSSTPTTGSNHPAEGEIMPSLAFSAEEMLDFIARNTTLHKKVDLLYVVDGYEAAVTYDDTPLSPVYRGATVQDAICALMLGLQGLERIGR